MGPFLKSTAQEHRHLAQAVWGWYTFVCFCFLLPPWLTAFFSAVTFESPGESWLIDTQSRRICCIQCLGCCFAGCFALTDRQTSRQQPLIARASLYPSSPNVKQRSDASSKVWDAAMATLLSRVKSQINYLSQVKSRKQVRRRECCTRKREDAFTRQHHRGFRRGAACWRTWRLWVCCSVGVEYTNLECRNGKWSKKGQKWNVLEFVYFISNHKGTKGVRVFC